jgi:hypothetical protein
VLSLVLLILTIGFLTPDYHAKADKRIQPDDPLRLEHIIITLVMPEIEMSVGAFYADYLTDTPAVTSYFGTTFLGVEGGENIHTDGPNATDYLVTVEVTPYVGPHIPVGKDHVTLEISSDGSVSMTELRHIESYELPRRLQSLVKRPLP